jgi:lipoprotein NlpD
MDCAPQSDSRTRWQTAFTAAALFAAVALSGCSSRSLKPAPVEDRSSGGKPPVVAVVPSASTNGAPTAPLDIPKPLPGAENAGKPGYYTVKPGDTLIRVGLDSGQSWRDIVRWNNIENPNLIEVGQVLRVVAPGTAPGEAVAVAVARPIPAPGAVAPATPARPAASAATSGTPTSSPVAAATPPAAAASAASEDELAFIWPTSGGLITGFDEVKNKGLDLAGKAGDTVVAAADGRVVYAGAGLRGYGNLVILKHNNTYLTAYAHNQALLVKEDQSVRKGQKIAEMGNSDADRVKLHFEIRKQGKPVDPAKLLPIRSQ